jgi:hypothetical protein
MSDLLHSIAEIDPGVNVTAFVSWVATALFAQS